jgi:hypothetical protein
VKFPIHFDDFPLYSPGKSFAEWEKQAILVLEKNALTTFGLHDCYADFWLPHYPAFLEKIERLGTFKTLDQVTNEELFACAI